MTRTCRDETAQISHRWSALPLMVLAIVIAALTTQPATAATPDDAVLAWGYNGDGQLGDGDTNSATEPVEASLPDGVTVADLDAGFSHTLALGTDGTVYAWGRGTSGQLGVGTYVGSDVPVETHIPDGVTVTDIAAGGFHSLALTSDGTLLAWGDNTWGQLGDGTSTFRTEPVAVNTPAGVTFTAVAGGTYHSLALSSDGRVYAWGWNTFGQLGDGTTANRSEPVEVDLPAGVTITAIESGEYHSLALASDGTVYAWGQNAYGQVGDGTTVQRNAPAEVLVPEGVTVTDIAGGGYYSLALTSDGTVLSWGANNFGQLGIGSNTERHEPVEVHIPAGTVVTDIAGGGYHGLALTADGGVLAWGNNNGQVGDGTTTTRLEPVETLIPAGYTVTEISGGGSHSVAWAVRVMSTTVLAADPTETTVGKLVTLTATVTCTVAKPTGAVRFLNGDEEVGTADVDGDGRAVLITTDLPVGGNVITALYNGDGACPGSASGPVTVTVADDAPAPSGSPTPSPSGSDGGGAAPGPGGPVAGDALPATGSGSTLLTVGVAALAAVLIGTGLVLAARRRWRG